MLHTITLSPDPFELTKAPSDLLDLNARLTAEHERRADPWSFTVPEIREARRTGKSVFPLRPADPDASENLVFATDGTAIPVRIIRPHSRAPVGTFVHIHGGGFIMGEAVENDGRLRQLAEATGLVTVSVDYRLAPEHPFPAAFDDCLAVARAVIDGSLGVPTGFLAIGGESAGAHLAVVTLMRLRDEDGARPFHAANLVAGFYDLTLTLSAARANLPRMLINWTDLAEFARLTLPEGASAMAPHHSPAFADVSGLPPARFACGTNDLLCDETLLLAQRWAAAGNEATLAITPGGCHVFEFFNTESGHASNAAADAWLSDRIAAQT